MNSSLTLIGEDWRQRLRANDPSLADFAAADLDINEIIEWAHCTDKDVSRNRIRFIKTFPVFVPMLVWEPDDPFSSLIIDWIDRDEPLVENIAGLMGEVAPETVQYLIEKPLSVLSHQWIGEELSLVFALDSVSAQSRPKSKSDWEIFFDFQNACSPRPWDASGQFFGKLCSLGYKAARKEIRNSSNWDLDVLKDVTHYVDFLLDWAIAITTQPHPAGANVYSIERKSETFVRKNRGRASELVSWILSDRPVAKIVRNALLWRQAYAEEICLLQKRSNDPELVQWPALLRQPLLFDGIQVVSLTSIEEAIAESAALKTHIDDCVKDCVLGDAFLLSLRDQNGSHISTAKIYLSFQSGIVFPYEISHHRLNAEYAHQLECDVLDAALEWLRLPEQQPWLQTLLKFHADRRDSIQEKLDTLNLLDHSAACRVARQVIEDYESVVLELSKKDGG